MLKLVNKFHKTSIEVPVKEGIVSIRAAKRAEKDLCGVSGCYCDPLDATTQEFLERLTIAKWAKRGDVQVQDLEDTQFK